MTRKPSNGFHVQELGPAEEMSVAERGRRHLEGPPVGAGKWHCNTCHHEWTGHSKIRQCPKCHSPDLTQTPFESQAPAAKAGKPQAAKSQGPAEKAAAGVAVEMILCALIEPSPFQTRKHFDQTELEQLAATIAKVGVIQPIVVRRGHQGAYELLAGERRLRASKLAKRKEIIARVVDVTDEEAIEIMSLENLDRSDLNPIERAHTFQQMLEKGGYTQEILAKRWGISQEAISNAVRLLKLPENLQTRIITRQMSPTHAREVLPWADVPKVLEILGKVKPEDVGSAKDWRRTVLEAVKEASRPMTYITYSYGGGCMFKPTPAQKEQLDIREVPSWYGGQKERRAFNTKLWNELNGAAKKRKEEKADKADAGRNAEHRESRARMKADEAARSFVWNLFAARINWLQQRIGERIEKLSECSLWKTIVILSCEGEIPIGKALHMKDRYPSSTDVAEFLVPMTQKMLLESVRDAISFELERELEVNSYYVDSPAVSELWLMKLAAELGVDLAKQWEPTEAFIELYDYKQRKELVTPWETAVVDDGKLEPAAVLKAWPKGFIPDEFLYATKEGVIKRPKGTAKPKPKKRAKAGAK